jgi:hypothetical protein
MNGERGGELAGTAAVGGLFGGITGGLGSIGGAALGSGIRALGGGLRGAGQSALSAARGEVSNIASGRLGGLAGRATRCNSFAPGAAVVMVDGSSKPIEDVRVGDMVLATDPTTGETEGKPVTDLIVGQGEKKLVEVTVDVDGDQGDQTGTVVATDGHPFWSQDLRTWVNATDLQVGALLRTSTGTYVQVTAIERWTEPSQRVHNLTVDGLHTYYVLAGHTPVLVHNCGGSVEGHSLRCECATGGNPIELPNFRQLPTRPDPGEMKAHTRHPMQPPNLSEWARDPRTPAVPTTRWGKFKYNVARVLDIGDDVGGWF